MVSTLLRFLNVRSRRACCLYVSFPVEKRRDREGDQRGVICRSAASEKAVKGSGCIAKKIRAASRNRSEKGGLWKEMTGPTKGGRNKKNYVAEE